MSGHVGRLGASTAQASQTSIQRRGMAMLTRPSPRAAQMATRASLVRATHSFPGIPKEVSVVDRPGSGRTRGQHQADERECFVLAISCAAVAEHCLFQIADGIEDWQLFQRLGSADLNGGRVSKGGDLIAQLISNLTSRVEDPRLLEKVRREAAHRVMAQGSPPSLCSSS